MEAFINGMQLPESTQPKAVIVVLQRGQADELPLDYAVSELVELVRAAEAHVVARLSQNKPQIDAATYIGKGKVAELAALVAETGADLVIFNNELSGSQIRNLTEAVGVDVIDRTMLILDIFARRAKSSISKMQVELAQLRYRLPRLSGLGEEMSRSGAGIGTRGPGEQKLELDRRRIHKRIADLQAKLNEATAKRRVTKKQRVKSELPIVALVGYTNAGKSTIMNYFVEHYGHGDGDKRVLVKDMLFATLDTYYRKIEIDTHKAFVLIDTVGFISQLPHRLIEAFKATLDELADADLLIQVIDASDPNAAIQQEVTARTLREIGSAHQPVITVYNKADLLSEQTEGEDTALYLSMKDGQNIDLLIRKIDEVLFSSMQKVVMLLPYTAGADLNRLMSAGKVLTTEHLESGSKIEIELSESLIEKYSHYLSEES